MKNITVLKKEKIKGIEIAMLKDNDANAYPYIVAWKFDENSKSWGQGHYFSSEIEALIKFNSYK